ncbi:unnamed protein product [Clavelina lepadiformis]|uniref:G-protein coupled receptors family 1 profile domain-containing protein n=2 Tax=Clavelina lepadiformis TaxID=159417 RepID=A0ABP0GBR2_CLALP
MSANITMHVVGAAASIELNSVQESARNHYTTRSYEGSASFMTNATAAPYCVLKNSAFRSSHLITGAAILPIHFFLALSLIVYRQKLRRKVINIYATNVVLSNFFICLCRIASAWKFIFVSPTMPLYNQRNISTPLLHVWFGMELLLPLVTLVKSGGIALIIKALTEDILRIHKIVIGLADYNDDIRNSGRTIGSSASNGKCWKWTHPSPRRKAVRLILLSWIIPVIVGICVGYDGDCIYECACVVYYVPSDKSVPICPVEKNCYPKWPPLTRSSTLTLGFVWVAYSAILIILCVQSYINFKLLVRKKISCLEKGSTVTPRATYVSSPSSDGLTVSTLTTISTQIHQTENEGEAETSEKATSKKKPKLSRGIVKNRFHKSKSQGTSKLLQHSLSKRIIFMVIVSIVFVVGTGVMIIMTLVTALKPSTGKPLGHKPPLWVLAVVADTILSIFLCSSFLGLRNAVRSMFWRIVRCC